jgi:hypothetical protein
VLLPSTSAGFHDPATPIGVADVSTSLPSTATHSDTDGHDTALPPTLPAVGLQAAVPPVGSAEVNSFPPTATHSDTDGQDTPHNPLICPSGNVWSTSRGEDHLRGDDANADPADAAHTKSTAASVAVIVSARPPAPYRQLVPVILISRLLSDRSQQHRVLQR